MSCVSAAIYIQCICVSLCIQVFAVFFYTTLAGFTTRGLATPSKAAMFSILPNEVVFNYKFCKQWKEGVGFFFSYIYLWVIAHSGPGIEQPHWSRAITGCEHDRQPARINGRKQHRAEVNRKCVAKQFHNKKG